MPRGISRRVGSRQLPVTSYVVLGLIGRRPGAGYDLAAFAARSIAHMWPITHSQIYSELPRLEGLGLITGTDVAQQRRPDKRTYQLTPEGQRALVEWLEDPAVEERFHSSLLAQLFFASAAPPERAAEILAACARRAKAQREHLQGVVDLLADRPDAFFPRATALYAVRQAEAAEKWVAEMQVALTESGVRAPRRP